MNTVEARAKMAESLECAHPLLFEMAPFLRNRHPELSANIWVLIKSTSHEPRIQIQRDKEARLKIDETFSMTISDAPILVGDAGPILSDQDIASFKEFVAKNKSTLLDYWEGNLDTSELVHNLIF